MTNRDETIQAIRKALKARSGKAWSVRGHRGTAYGWITISAPPARMVGYEIAEADRDELKRLLDLDSVHSQGVNVPASSRHYQEYIDRAEGRAPSVIGERYWD